MTCAAGMKNSRRQRTGGSTVSRCTVFGSRKSSSGRVVTGFGSPTTYTATALSVGKGFDEGGAVFVRFVVRGATATRLLLGTVK